MSSSASSVIPEEADEQLVWGFLLLASDRSGLPVPSAICVVGLLRSVFNATLSQRHIFKEVLGLIDSLLFSNENPYTIFYVWAAQQTVKQHGSSGLMVLSK